MSELVRFDGLLPMGDEFNKLRTGLWMEVDGKIEVVETDGEFRIHADVWGGAAWGTSARGYLFDSLALVTCHGSVTGELEKKLARKFKDIVYVLDCDLD